MLVITSQSSLSDTDKIAAVAFHRMMAVDVETGAYLMPSHGRSRWAPKYFLILPHETPKDRGGIMGTRKCSFAFERAIIRAWSDEEAVTIANKRLPRLLKRAQQAAVTDALPVADGDQNSTPAP